MPLFTIHTYKAFETRNVRGSHVEAGDSCDAICYVTVANAHSRFPAGLTFFWSWSYTRGDSLVTMLGRITKAGLPSDTQLQWNWTQDLHKVRPTSTVIADHIKKEPQRP